MDTLAIQTIYAAKQAPCPPIQKSGWTPPPLFSEFENMQWFPSGKREHLNNKIGQPKPLLLGPLLLNRCGVTEKKWTISVSLDLPTCKQDKFGKMHARLREWLASFYDGESLFLSRWKKDFRGNRRPAVRWWKAKKGNFERTTEPAEGLIFCVVDKFQKAEDQIFVELGMDTIVV